MGLWDDELKGLWGDGGRVLFVFSLMRLVTTDKYHAGNSCKSSLNCYQKQI